MTCAHYDCQAPATMREVYVKRVTPRVTVVAFYYTCRRHAMPAARPLAVFPAAPPEADDVELLSEQAEAEAERRYDRLIQETDLSSEEIGSVLHR